MRSRLILLLVYLFAFSLAFIVGTFNGYPVLLKSATSVGMAVIVLFMASLDFNNSSVFDPFWSVTPPLMVCYFWFLSFSMQPAAIFHWSLVTENLNAFHRSGAWSGIDTMNIPRVTILLILTLVYGTRLTWNFLRGWKGLKHEDWRYADMRKITGKGYWFVSLFGIHLFPALMVFAGCLPVWVTVICGMHGPNFLDILAILVTGNAILLEALADRQLHRFLANNAGNGKTMDQGLWSVCRHPNYLGEISFWWGLYLFALAANPSFWWVIIGPLAITLMFIVISIPMIEKRNVQRRSGYTLYQQRVPMLIPFLNFHHPDQ